MRNFARKFITHAEFHLAPEVFPSKARREAAWKSALVHAAEKGNFQQMTEDVYLYSDKQGQNPKTCEQLLAMLERKYTKGEEVLQEEAFEKLHSTEREGKTLLQAITDLETGLYEYRRYGGRPDDVTVRCLAKKQAQSQEITLAKVKLDAKISKGAIEAATAEDLLDCLREVAIDGETLKGKDRGSGRSTSEFVGAAAWRDKGRRGGYNVSEHRGSDDRTGYSKGGSNYGGRQDSEFKASEARSEKKKQPEHEKCDRCGWRHDDGECRAVGKRCDRCRKIGHLAKMCRSGEPAETSSESDNQKGSKNNNRHHGHAGAAVAFSVTDMRLNDKNAYEGGIHLAGF